MNTFLLPEKDRLLSWREHRNTLAKLEDTEKFKALTRWWATAPICAYSIDADDTKNWPTPWELLNEGVFCTSGIAYMMAATLLLSGFDRSRLSMPFIKGQDDERLVVLIDDQIVLNYSYGEVFDWDEIRDDFHVFHTWVWPGDSDATLPVKAQA